MAGLLCLFTVFGIYSCLYSWRRLSIGFSVSSKQKSLFFRKHVLYVLGFIFIWIWSIISSFIFMYYEKKFESYEKSWKDKKAKHKDSDIFNIYSVTAIVFNRVKLKNIELKIDWSYYSLGIRVDFSNYKIQ